MQLSTVRENVSEATRVEATQGDARCVELQVRVHGLVWSVFLWVVVSDCFVSQMLEGSLCSEIRVSRRAQSSQEKTRRWETRPVPHYREFYFWSTDSVCVCVCLFEVICELCSWNEYLGQQLCCKETRTKIFSNGKVLSSGDLWVLTRFSFHSFNSNNNINYLTWHNCVECIIKNVCVFRLSVSSRWLWCERTHLG